MPIIKSAKKAARQAVKRTEHNAEIKKSIRTAKKNLIKNPSFENLQKAQSEYDKAVKKDLMKKNTASRRKSALAALAKSLGVKVAKAERVEKVKAEKPAKAETKKTTAAKSAK